MLQFLHDGNFSGDVSFLFRIGQTLSIDSLDSHSLTCFNVSGLEDLGEGAFADLPQNFVIAHLSAHENQSGANCPRPRPCHPTLRHVRVRAHEMKPGAGACAAPFLKRRGA